MRYHFAFVRMAIIFKKRERKRETTGVSEDVDRLKPLHTVGRNANAAAIMENSMEFPQNIKNRTIQ